MIENMMELSTGTTYKFDLIEDFALLNGVYTVTQILTFSELLSIPIDLVEDLYSKVGKTEEDYNAHLTELRKGNVYKVVDVYDDERILFFPARLFKTAPDPSVKKYSQIVLATDMGVTDDINQVDHIIQLVHDQIITNFGIQTVPRLLERDAKWLLPSEFQTILQEREANKGQAINYFSKCKSLQNEITRLKTIISKYEEIIKAKGGNSTPVEP